MSEKLPYAKKTDSYKAYKKGAFWQILFPMLIVLLLCIAASVLTVAGTAENASLGADISTILLFVPLLLTALLAFAILGGMVYGMAKLLDITPTYTRKLYLLVKLAGDKLQEFADASVKPIFMGEEASAKVKSLFGKNKK